MQVQKAHLIASMEFLQARLLPGEAEIHVRSTERESCGGFRLPSNSLKELIPLI